MERYKTKFLKSYRTDLLKKLPSNAFRDEGGYWRKGSMEAVLEYSALEMSCGSYFMLPEILYKVPKSQLESIDVVSQARNSRKFSCQNKNTCLLYTSPSPRDQRGARMPSSA